MPPASRLFHLHLTAQHDVLLYGPHDVGSGGSGSDGGVCSPPATTTTTDARLPDDTALAAVRWPVASGVTRADVQAGTQLASRISVGAGVEVVLTAEVPSGGADSVGVERTYRVPLAKSGVQKAVRRRDAAAASDVALQLLLQGGDAAVQIVRRLPVVCVEDSLPHPGLVTLSVFLMLAAARGYSPTLPVACTVAARVAETAAVRRRFAPAEFAERFPAYRRAEAVLRATGGSGGGGDAAGGSPPPTVFGFCLRARRAFGGMPHDMRMLDAVLTFVERDALYGGGGGGAAAAAASSFEGRCRRAYADAAVACDVAAALLPPPRAAEAGAAPPPPPTARACVLARCGDRIVAASEADGAPRLVLRPLPGASCVAEAADAHCFAFLPGRVTRVLQERFRVTDVDEAAVRRLWWSRQSGVYDEEKLLCDPFTFRAPTAEAVAGEGAGGEGCRHEGTGDGESADARHWTVVRMAIQEVLIELRPWELPASEGYAGGRGGGRDGGGGGGGTSSSQHPASSPNGGGGSGRKRRADGTQPSILDVFKKVAAAPTAPPPPPKQRRRAAAAVGQDAREGAAAGAAGCVEVIVLD